MSLIPCKRMWDKIADFSVRNIHLKKWSIVQPAMLVDRGVQFTCFVVNLSRPFVDMSCASAACSHWSFGHPCLCLAWDCRISAGWRYGDTMVIKHAWKPTIVRVDKITTNLSNTIWLYTWFIMYLSNNMGVFLSIILFYQTNTCQT